MLNRWQGDLNVLKGRPRVTEDIVAPNYGEYYYLMHTLPIVLDAKTVVETGLGWAHSTKIFLEGLSALTQPRSLHTYTLETVFGGIPIGDTEKLVRDLNFPTPWILHVQDSVEGANQWTGPKIELLYLDSAHELQHVANELNAWLPHLADKAVVFTDDIWCQNTPHAALNVRNPGVCPTDPYWSFDDFANVHPEWKQVTFSYPEGKAFLFRGFGLK